MKSKLSTILINLRNRIINASIGFTDASCYMAVEANVPPPLSLTSGPSLAIVPVDTRPEVGCVTGMGRYGSVQIAQVDTIIYLRAGLDVAYENSVGLTTQTNNLLDLAHAVLNTLQLYQPVDSIGQSLLIEPLRSLGEKKPQRYKKTAEWLYVAMSWEIKYNPDLDVSSFV